MGNEHFPQDSLMFIVQWSLERTQPSLEVADSTWDRDSLDSGPDRDQTETRRSWL